MKIINKRIIAIITLGTVLTFSNIANAKTFNEVSSTASSQNSKLQEALKSIGIELYPAKQCMIADIKDKVDVNGTPVADCTTYYVDDYINPTVVYEWNDSSESFSQVNKNCYIDLNSEPYHFVGFPKDQLIIGYKDATPDLPKDQTHIIIPILEDALINQCKKYNKNLLRADYYLDANYEELYYSGCVNNYLNPTEAYSKDKFYGLIIDKDRYNGIFSSNTLHRQQNKKGYKVLGWKDTTPNLPSNEAHKIVAITTEDFPDAEYYIGKEFFTRAYVDNLENPTKVYDNYNNKDNPIKDFANVNDSRNTSSNIEDYVPEGYVFKGWKVDGMDEDCPEITVLRAILEKDQEYIDNMETSIDFSLKHSEAWWEDYNKIYINYNDEVSKAVEVKYTVVGSNGLYRDECTISTDPSFRDKYGLNFRYRESLSGDILTFAGDNLAPGTYTITVEVTNDLGKVTTAEKTYTAEELCDKVSTDPTYYDIDPNKEYYYGDKIYIRNLPSDEYWIVKNLQEDENGCYVIIDKYFIGTWSRCAVDNTLNLDETFDPATRIWNLDIGFSNVTTTKALKVHNISRDGKSVAFGELPKQEEPETPVEPATKTPEPETPATETPKQDEETKPSEPSKTSDASNVALALAGLTLTGVALTKTKKNA